MKNRALTAFAAMALMCLTACGTHPSKPMAPPLKPCPASPNCVCSDATSATHAIDALRATAELDLAWQALLEHLEERTDVTIVRREPTYVAAEFRTRLLRFVDDVEFEMRLGENIIAVRSASRVGFSDLGANRRRIEQIRKTLAAQGLIEPRK